jgi:hypothetical protein
MRHIAFFLGLLGILFGILLSQAVAQDDDLEYIGARDCRSCHRDVGGTFEESYHARTLLDVEDEDDKDLILGDFAQGEDLRTVTFSDGETRPFGPEDIFLTLGTGRRKQAYLFELDRNEYLLLPAQWDVTSQTWEPLALADDWPDDAYQFGPNCAGCHTVGLDVEDYRWEDEGVQCEACHGPGSAHADLADEAGSRPSDEEYAAIVGAINIAWDAQVCGQCHIRGHEPDQNHPFPIDYLPGGNLLDPEVFVPVAPDDKSYWWPTGHAKQSYMQFNEWLNSSHASALNTMRASGFAGESCLQCHSGDYRSNEALIARYDEGERDGVPPEPITLQSAEWGITCVNCHNPHAETEADPYEMCVECHVNPPDATGFHHPVQEMFEGAPVIAEVEAVPGAHFTAEGGPDCSSCHLSQIPVGDHTRATHLLHPVIPEPGETDPPSACVECHEDLQPVDVKYLVEDTRAAVTERLTAATVRLSTITPPVGDSQAQAAHERITQILNFIQGDGSLGMHNYAYTDALLTTAEESLTELSQSGVELQPTEAPAPTSIPADVPDIAASASETVPTGVRPMTFIIIGFALLVLLISAVLFFRPSKQEV